MDFFKLIKLENCIPSIFKGSSDPQPNGAVSLNLYVSLLSKMHLVRVVVVPVIFWVSVPLPPVPSAFLITTFSKYKKLCKEISEETRRGTRVLHLEVRKILDIETLQMCFSGIPRLLVTVQVKYRKKQK